MIGVVKKKIQQPVNENVELSILRFLSFEELHSRLTNNITFIIIEDTIQYSRITHITIPLGDKPHKSYYLIGY